MAKKPTAKQLAARKAASERMKAMHEAKKVKSTGTVDPEAATVNPTSQPVDPGEVKNPDFGDLLKQIAELKDNPLIQALFSQNNQPAPAGDNGLSVNRGRVVGTMERYITDPAHYPSPVERLRDEPKLSRFAFKQNYELDYKCLPTRPYETKDGLMMTEPQFKIELHGVVFDEETGEPTNQRYLVCKSTFFEDPQAAIVVAREQGLDVDENNQKAFLDEMRYIRMRDWLFEAFYPPKITGTKKNIKEQVIGGKLVQTWEISSEDSQSIPFDKLSGKV